jgi:hypothetical protein
VRLAIVVPHFNPCNYLRPSSNLAQFFYSLLQQCSGCDCVAYAKFSGDGDFADYLGGLTIEAGQQNLMWQKEALINAAIRDLPPEFDAIAWIDGDLLFDNADWYEQTGRALESTPVVQMFTTVTYLGPNDEPTRRGWSTAAVGDRAKWRAPGGAVACRRELLEHGIYDRDILGGGDDILMSACLGCHERVCRKLNEPFQASVRRWCESFGSHSVGAVSGNVRHLYHGALRNRGYATKREILAAHKYDPETDVQVGSNGLLQWSSKKPALHAAVRDYFVGRREDDVAANIATPAAPAE